MSKHRRPMISRRITRYREPVATRAELPSDGVSQGESCYVSDEMIHYAFTEGAWIPKTEYDRRRR